MRDDNKDNAKIDPLEVGDIVTPNKLSPASATPKNNNKIGYVSGEYNSENYAGKGILIVTWNNDDNKSHYVKATSSDYLTKLS